MDLRKTSFIEPRVSLANLVSAQLDIKRNHSFNLKPINSNNVNQFRKASFDSRNRKFSNNTEMSGVKPNPTNSDLFIMLTSKSTSSHKLHSVSQNVC